MALGLHYAYAAAMPYDGGDFGIAILSRGAISDVRIERLPRGGEEEPRIALLATCQVRDGQTIRFANTHLAADWHAQNPERLRALQTESLAQTLFEEAQVCKHPLFLVGDLNCGSDSEAIANLRQIARPLHDDIRTYPVAAPTDALDHVFYVPAMPADRYRVETIEVQAASSTASDHLPLCAEVEISAR
jgi:endonuclease/exonuclease/phosphatase family metal-dependent hydrolase